MTPLSLSRSRQPKKIVFILGPTASGKSHFALTVAEKFQAPILNADSIQVYHGLEVGSSAPTRDDRKRAVHHLYGFVAPPMTFTAAHHLKAVKDILEQYPQQPHWILCGGSGFYLQALEKGMTPLSETSDEIKAKVALWIAEHGWDKAHKEVARVHGGKIHLNDHYRIQRALEIMEVRKLPQEQPQSNVESPFIGFEKLKIGFKADKEQLKIRVQSRICLMLEQGFVQEVQKFLDLGLADWPPLQSVGYFEVKEYLEGRCHQTELVEKITISTLQLIKKQMTWFKRDPEIQWFEIGEDEAALAVVKTWFNNSTP